MKTTDNERLKKIIENIGKPINFIAKEIGVSQPSLKACVDGNNKPSFDTIQKLILVYPDINSNWLLTGKGEMLLNTEIKITDIEIANDIINNSRQIGYLYQKIVDVDILIKEHLNIIEKDDFVEMAAEVLNNVRWVKWNDYNISGKRLHNEELKKTVKLFTEIFFDRFKVLYNTMCGYN